MSDIDKAELEQQPHSADETTAALTNQQDVTITGVANLDMLADSNKRYYVESKTAADVGSRGSKGVYLQRVSWRVSDVRSHFYGSIKAHRVPGRIACENEQSSVARPNSWPALLWPWMPSAANHVSAATPFLDPPHVPWRLPAAALRPALAAHRRAACIPG